MKILAIETSCDETAAAVVKAGRGRFEILSNVISSQVKVHAKYGGVVPEVAARLHIEKILPIVQLALSQAKIKVSDVAAIAVCAGPGLISSLLVGVETAKTLAYAFSKPLVKVNHIEGHLLSSSGLAKNQEIKKSRNQDFEIKFPAVGLIVSGGHTQLILVKDYLKYKLIGETLDDAAGEAFDKAAKIMGIGYPGGPAISAWAEKAQNSKLQVQNKSKIQNLKFQSPRPMINSGDFTMSFSGLKTAILYSWQKLSVGLTGKALDELKAEFACEFQQAVVDVLAAKTLAAAEKYHARTIMLGGGVSANKSLRKTLGQRIEKKLPNVEFLYPDMVMTGDNAAMIAMAAYYHIIRKDFVSPFKLKADPQWELV